MFSDPVVGENFFGRQDIIDVLLKRANALKAGYRQNVALIGHQQLGKTSILRHFLHVYRDPDVLSVYVEIKLQALDYFIEQFVRSLLFQFLSLGSQTDPSASLQQLAQLAQPLIPKTVARIHEISALLKQRQAEEAYSKLFELTSIIKSETGKNCIVILDEFHRLGEFGIRNAFSDFGKKIMLQKDTLYLLSSSSFSASKKILAEKLSLLFGHFERIYLEPFDFDTSFEFIDRKLRPFEAPQNLKHFLVAFTDGHPFFLDTILARVKEQCLLKDEKAVTRAVIAEALLKLLFESQGVLNQYFMKLISSWTRANSHGSHLLILAALANGRNKLKDVASSLNRRQSEVSRQIQELIEHELILKNGMFYRFHNKIFKFWLKEVYEKKELSLLGISGKNMDFLARIEEIVAEYDEILGVRAADRVFGLLTQFNNEIVELGEKRRKLPHFTELIETHPSEEMSGGSKSLVAKGNGRCWVCKIVEEKATEKEILELLDGAARNKKACPTKVLVALSGMDEHAKLLAKEKKILTLGLSRVNMLMDIYGKRPIVRVKPRLLEHFSAEPAPAE